MVLAVFLHALSYHETVHTVIRMPPCSSKLKLTVLLQKTMFINFLKQINMDKQYKPVRTLL